TLTFVNSAVAAGVGSSPTGYAATWGVFDNLSGQIQAVGGPVNAQTTRIQTPAALPTDDGRFVKIQVAAAGAPTAPRSVPADVYCRRVAGSWKLVGLERLK